MTDYIEKELERINPCGIESQPSTHCKYAGQCPALGRASGGFVCLSQMGYQIAKCLIQGGNVNTERRNLRNRLTNSDDKSVIDPKKETWAPIRLDKNPLWQVIDEIISRGEELSQIAVSIGSSRNPLEIDCSVDAIIADL